VAQRPWYLNLYWAVRDYLKRIWDNSAEDNVLFLAGGIAFNILLAAIPFVLLLITGLTYLVPAVSDVDPTTAVDAFIDQLLPMHAETSGGLIHTMITDVLRTRGSVTLYSAILSRRSSTSRTSAASSAARSSISRSPSSARSCSSSARW